MIKDRNWWFCRWGIDTPFATSSGYDVSDAGFQMTFRNGVTFVSGYIPSATEPTLAEFAAAVKDATGVEIPVPEEEEPRWHVWSFEGGAWVENPYTYGGVFINKDCVEVYGTTADRDAKRDALLEAARKAGQP